MEEHLNHLEHTVKAKTELMLKHHAITTQSEDGGKHLRIRRHTARCLAVNG
jgi:hypothetical protein